MSSPAAYGSWRSPLAAEQLAAAALRLGDVCVDGLDVWWTESRPLEGGRAAAVRWRDGQRTDMGGAELSVRDAVHEYGGGALVADSGVGYGTTTDGRVWRLDESSATPVTNADGRRYADFVMDRRRHRLIAVCEDHRQAACPASLVAIDLGSGTVSDLHSGDDFYAAPRLSPDASRLAWISWQQPRMPWDGTELWQAELDDQGLLQGAARCIGGPGESVLQPRFLRDGSLCCVSDRSGYWNVCRVRDHTVVPLLTLEADCALPPWNFGVSSYTELHNGTLAISACRDGIWELWLADAVVARRLELDATVLGSHTEAVGERLLLTAGSPTEPVGLVLLTPATGLLERIWTPHRITLADDDIATAEAIRYPTLDGSTGHGFYYPPRNAHFRGPDDERPPLMVRAHGGPTAQADTALDLSIQYWTSRGFGFLDVNYGGSTGYGRRYRDRLLGQMGCVDVDDCVAAADHLAARGDVDPDRIVLSGGSHGGYVTLAALVFHPRAFAGGISRYGFGDLEALSQYSGHKFEARYLDQLVGRLPEAASLYHNRSPIQLAAFIQRPLLMLHGEDDAVVPLAQTTSMVAALREQGTPHSLITFAGEGHGFRRAETVLAAQQAELAFCAQVLHLSPAEPLVALLLQTTVS